MANVVLMPQAGITVESCVIGTWKKQIGDSVSIGEVLFDYETDKALFECESTAEGTLLETFFSEGDEVPVLTPVCAIGSAGEDVSALRPDGATDTQNNVDSAVVQEVKEETSAVKTEAAVKTGSGEEGFVSPRARMLASDKHVDLRMAEPTGPNGRIIERDVRLAMEKGYISTGAAENAVSGMEAGSIDGSGIGGRISVADIKSGAVKTHIVDSSLDIPEYEDEEFSKIRKIIAKGMKESLSNIPQLTHNFSFDASAIKAYRAQVKKSKEELGATKITLGDMILFAVSKTILKYPELNANMLDDTHIRKFNTVNLGFACDTPRGLMVPVIKNAERKSLLEISNEVKELASKARNGNLSPDKMSGATFTVSNLGSYGVESFTPIINVPQTGILGVDTIVERVRAKDGQISVYPAMGLSLTYDHRAVDGGPASQFVQELCSNLENFSVLLSL